MYKIAFVVSFLLAIAGVMVAMSKELPQSPKSADFLVKGSESSRGIEVVVDVETGCEYLLSSRGGITLRKGVNQFQTQCR